MITLYDYLPSQNAYKVRLLLNHLERPYVTKIVQIFAGEGRDLSFLLKNPTGAVPVLELEDGQVLAESNAILFYLAQGTAYLPSDAWSQAQVMRWMFFEEDFIQNGLASLRRSSRPALAPTLRLTPRHRRRWVSRQDNCAAISISAGGWDYPISAGCSLAQPLEAFVG
jgi:glutathione S-transferase